MNLTLHPHCTLKAVDSSKTQVPFYWDNWYHIPENSNLKFLNIVIKIHSYEFNGKKLNRAADLLIIH
jgi:hypothetical protein